MKILADFHHGALYHSLQLLFENRLGYEVYRPIGMEWYNEDFWNVYPHKDTAKQFLGLHQADKHPVDVHGDPLPPDACVNLNYTIEDGVYYVKDMGHGINHRAVTLEKFSSMQFDVLLSSIPQHIPRFDRLAAERMPGAKQIFQVGNAWGHQGGVKNILASTAPFAVPADVNACFYHQEFDTDLFSPSLTFDTHSLRSYVHYMKRPDLMDAVATHLHEWTVEKYGAGFEALHGAIPVAKKMRSGAFTWHYKPEGDGYGHVLHSTYACGRPAVVDKRHYAGKLADQLLIPDVTCIDINGLQPDQIAAKLLHWSEPVNYSQMSQAAYNRFNEVVNFKTEGEAVKQFMEKLI